VLLSDYFFFSVLNETPSRIATLRAKQSILSLCREVDCFASLAMTRMGRGALDTPHVWDIACCSGGTKSFSGRRSGFRNASHAHVKGLFEVQIDND